MILLNCRLKQAAPPETGPSRRLFYSWRWVTETSIIICIIIVILSVLVFICDFIFASHRPWRCSKMTGTKFLSMSAHAPKTSAFSTFCGFLSKIPTWRAQRRPWVRWRISPYPSASLETLWWAPWRSWPPWLIPELPLLPPRQRWVRNYGKNFRFSCQFYCTIAMLKKVTSINDCLIIEPNFFIINIYS